MWARRIGAHACIVCSKEGSPSMELRSWLVAKKHSSHAGSFRGIPCCVITTIASKHYFSSPMKNMYKRSTTQFCFNPWTSLYMATIFFLLLFSRKASNNCTQKIKCKKKGRTTLSSFKHCFAWRKENSFCISGPNNIANSWTY